MTIIDTDKTPLVRLDYSDDEAWARVCELATAANPEGFSAELQMMEDPEIAGQDPQQVAPLFLEEFALLVFADKASMTGEHTLLCVNPETPEESFRCVPAELWAPENNLRLHNMGFAEFSSAVDHEGVFRGF